MDQASSAQTAREFEEFDGPLDLLLDEVRRQNVAIERVRLAPVTRRFLEYVRTASQRSLALNIDWLQMAATLIHWKSQALLPAESGGESSEPIPEELVQQLLAHKKQLAEDLARRRALVEASFSRFPEEETPPKPAVETVTAWDLIQQARELASWVLRYREGARSTAAVFDIEPEAVLVADMIAFLEDQLATVEGHLDGLQLLMQQPSAARRSSLFLAMLEMARDRRVDIIQESQFAPIYLIPIGLSATHQVNH